MQASLLNGFQSPRADHVFAGSAGSGAIKSRFDSILAEHRDTPGSQEMLPQEERTIRRRPEAEAPNEPSAVESDRPVDNAAKPSETQSERKSETDDDAHDEKPVAAKRDQVKEEDRDSSKEAEAQAVFAAMLAATPAEQVQDVTTEATGDIETGAEAQLEGVDAAQLAMKLAGDETGVDPKLAQQVAPAAGEKQQGGDAKLKDIVQEMEPASEAVEIQQTSESNEDPSDGADQPSEHPLGEQVAKLADADKPSDPKGNASPFDRGLNALVSNVETQSKQDVSNAAKLQAPLPLPPEQKFAQDNIDNVVTSVRTQSLNGGGQMNVRLDPPELGALQVAVKMIEGRLTASFTTSNDQATQLLSHNLQHLKSSLEAGGVNVDRIEVRQAPQSESSQNKSSSDSQQQQQRGFDSQSQQSEQQRKEMVRRMWRKLAYGGDDLDLVA